MYADSIAVYDRRISWEPNTPPAPYPASPSHAMRENLIDSSSQNKPYQSRVLVPNNHKRPDFLELHRKQPGNQTPPRPFRKSARVLKAWRSSNAILPVISRNNSPPSTRPKSMKNLDSSNKASKSNMNKQKSCEEDRRMIPGYVASSSENISHLSDHVNDKNGNNKKNFRITVASATAEPNEASNGDNTIRKERIVPGGDHFSRRCSPKEQQNSTSGSGSMNIGCIGSGSNFRDIQQYNSLEPNLHNLNANSDDVKFTGRKSKNTAYDETIEVIDNNQEALINDNYILTSSAMSTSADIALVAKYNLDAKTMKLYKQAFRIFDRNGDGCITTEELGTVMQFLGYKPMDDELASMVKEADEDGNGTIEFEEFVNMMRRHVEKKQKQHRQGTIDDLCDAFYVFDRDKDGYITAKELRDVMKSLGEELTDAELNAMIGAADTDGDGRINLQEFQIIWRKATPTEETV